VAASPAGQVGSLTASAAGQVRSLATSLDGQAWISGSLLSWPGMDP
jgi:hypothetical protein